MAKKSVNSASLKAAYVDKKCSSKRSFEAILPVAQTSISKRGFEASLPVFIALESIKPNICLSTLEFFEYFK